MKVYDIISEEKQQLNEFVPLLIGGLTIGGILTAINLGISAWGAYDIYQFVKKYNDDPDKITDDEWGDLWIDAALLFAPAIGKFGRAAFVKVLPKSWIIKGGAWFKRSVLKIYAKSATKGLAGADRIKALKAIAKESRSVASAQKSINALGTAWKIIQTLGISVVGYNYWTELSALDEEFRKFKGGDKTTKIFGNSTDSDAYEVYLDLHAKILGELTIAVGGFVGGMAVGKTIGFLGNFIGKTPVVGWAVKIPFDIASGLAKMMGNTSVYIPLFMATDAGKKFMESGIITLITKGIGHMEQGAIELLSKALEEIGVSKGVTDKIPGKTEEPPASVQANDAESDKYIKTGQGNPALRKRTVGKQIYIGNVLVTDDDGYLLPSVGSRIQDIQDKAKIVGEPDPTAGIPKKPGVDYTN